jgi:glycosyltransferase involved in cell wall biosynthesis
VAEAVGDGALLIPSGDADAAARALARIGADNELRERLIERGLAVVRRHTREVESGRVAAFMKRELALAPAGHPPLG